MVNKIGEQGRRVVHILHWVRLYSRGDVYYERSPASKFTVSSTMASISSAATDVAAARVYEEEGL